MAHFERAMEEVDAGTGDGETASPAGQVGAEVG